MGHGLQLYPLFLCRLYDDLFQLAACCTCRCHKEPICCLRDGKDPCRWRKGRGRYQSFYPQLDQLSYHHNSKWAILEKIKADGFLVFLLVSYDFCRFLMALKASLGFFMNWIPWAPYAAWDNEYGSICILCSVLGVF